MFILFIIHHFRRKGAGAPGNVGQAHQTAGLVGRFQQAEMGRQEKGLIHVQRRNELARQKVAAGVAGHHKPVQALIIEPVLAEQGGEAVDAGGEVGGEGVVIIGAEHHQRVAAADGGIDLLHHGAAAVKAAPLLAEVQAGGVAAAVAVRHGAVAQADLLHLHLRRQAPAHQLPEGKRIGGAALGGVERQHMAEGSGLLPLLQAGEQLRHRRAEGCLFVYAADLRLHAEIAQGAGGLHQRATQKGTARLIGGKNHVTGYVLGIKLPYAGDHHAGHAAAEQVGAAAQAGEHAVVGFVAAALVQRHGKEQAAAAQVLQAVLGIGELAAGGQQGQEHLGQSRTIFIFGQKNCQRHGVFPSFMEWRAAFSPFPAGGQEAPPAAAGARTPRPWASCGCARP